MGEDVMKQINRLAFEKGRMRFLIDEVITTMNHAETFIRTREKMNPVGIDLWCKLVNRLQECLDDQNKIQNTEGPAHERGVLVSKVGGMKPEWERADPAALAAFDPRTKVCTMNCGPTLDDPRSPEERRFLCADCDTVKLPRQQDFDWANRQLPAGITREDVCIWTQDSDESWNTSCGVTWEFNDGSPAENSAHFCHHCGGVLLSSPFE